MQIAIFRWARAGGIPPAEKQKAGKEAIEHARKALELYTQVSRTESADAAMAMSGLARALDYFNDVDDDDEILQLLEQAVSFYRRVEGGSSMNMAAAEEHLGNAYHHRAERAYAAKDLDRELLNLELALSLFREAAQTYRTINNIDEARNALKCVARVEEHIRRIRTIKEAIASSSTKDESE